MKKNLPKVIYKSPDHLLDGHYAHITKTKYGTFIIASNFCPEIYITDDNPLAIKHVVRTYSSQYKGRPYIKEEYFMI